MIYRYLVFDNAIYIYQPRHPIDFDEEGNVIGGMSFKEAKKLLIEQLRATTKAVKEENEEDYLRRFGYIK